MAKALTFNVGQQFYSWTVIDATVIVGPKRTNSAPARKIKCRCSCGNVRMVGIHALRRGGTKRCGEHKTSVLRKFPELYYAWSSARQRCENPNNPAYPHYGGRGVKMWPEWTDRADGFLRFVEYMGPRPPGTSLDRIDNNGDYAPGNVRWATRKQQTRNRRNSRRQEYMGRTQTLSAWAEELGLSFWRLQSRIERGWTMEEAVTWPDSYGTSPAVRKRITELETLLRQHGVAVPPWTPDADDLEETDP